LESHFHQHKAAITHNEIIESIANAPVYFITYRSHCTEALQRCCYNDGIDRFSCSDCNAFNDLIVCDRGLKCSSKQIEKTFAEKSGQHKH